MFDECVTWSEGKVGVYVLGPGSGLGREREGRAECARGLFLPGHSKTHLGKIPATRLCGQCVEILLSLGQNLFLLHAE